MPPKQVVANGAGRHAGQWVGSNLLQIAAETRESETTPCSESPARSDGSHTLAFVLCRQPLPVRAAVASSTVGLPPLRCRNVASLASAHQVEHAGLFGLLDQSMPERRVVAARA